MARVWREATDGRRTGSRDNAEAFTESRGSCADTTAWRGGVSAGGVRGLGLTKMVDRRAEAGQEARWREVRHRHLRFPEITLLRARGAFLYYILCTSTLFQSSSPLDSTLTLRGCRCVLSRPASSVRSPQRSARRAHLLNLRILRGFRPALLTASFVLSLSLGLVLLAR